MIRGIALCLALVASASAALARFDVQEIETAAGLSVWLVEDHSIPIVTLEAAFLGGASLDPEGKEGATRLAMSLLDEGAGDLDAVDFARARDMLATRIGFGASRDSVSVSLRTLTETLDASADLLHTAIHAPRFDGDAVERARAQMLSSARFEETDPGAIAGRALSAMAFPDHPYGRTIDGTVESMAALAVPDLRAALARVLVRDRAHISIVGDVTPEEAAALVDRLFADLPEAEVPLPKPADIALDGGTTVIDLDVPQSLALFSQPGLSREDPDFFPAFVMNHILGGGGFSSRLTQEVRVERGLTYSVGTSLSPRRYGPVLTGSVASSNDTIAEAIAVIRAEWARMAAEGVTEAELTAAKQYLTGAYPLRFDRASRIAGILVGLQARDLGQDYINTRNDMVDAVTTDDIQRVAARLLDPDGLHFVVVGRPEGLAPTQ
ncbi:MAG: pitrilysin family protein [Pseudomonadota bacterium]